MVPFVFVFYLFSISTEMLPNSAIIIIQNILVSVLRIALSDYVMNGYNNPINLQYIVSFNYFIVFIENIICFFHLKLP
jgi:hypothetical protein